MKAAPISLIAALTLVGAIAACRTEIKEVVRTVVVTQETVREVTVVVTTTSTSLASMGATATPVRTPALTVSPTATLTAATSPTPQPVARPSFVVNSQPVGCHAEPNAEAVVVLHLPSGSIQTMDQLIRLPNETWHREVELRCWTRTQLGPVEVLEDLTQARMRARRFAPPGTVLYQADWSSGLDGWRPTNGWKLLRGELLHDGGSGGQPFTAPFVPGTEGIDDYAVEVELQLSTGLGCGGWFGFVVRADYFVGIVTSRRTGIGFCFEPTSVIQFGLDDIKAERFHPDLQSHLWRVEVNGNRIRFLHDGFVVLEATDNRIIAGGHVALISNGPQFTVRKFRIIKL